MRSANKMWLTLLVACSLLLGLCQAQLSARCTSTLSAKYPAPSVADGYVVRLVANGLTTPRSIKFDTHGRLLVVEAGVGVSALTLLDAGGGCIREHSKKTVIAKTSLNHGLELSADGNQIFASDPDKAYRWKYVPSQAAISGPSAVLIDGMNPSGSDDGHITRTLLLSKTAPGMMVVNHGSYEDLDPLAKNLSSGSAQVRAFDITQSGNFPYDYESGTLMGWGVRNDVGIAEEPTKGGLYTVENGLVTRRIFLFRFLECWHNLKILTNNSPVVRTLRPETESIST